MERLVALEDALRHAPGVQLAVLFGSAATGRDRSSSDLDVGVLGVDAVSLSRLAVELSRASGRPVDLVSLKDAPPLLRFEIARAGRVLFEREPHLWADFRARAMIDWWDWAPVARMLHRAAAARLREQVSRGPA
jgi:predicted nucleotidyltransferase